MKLERLHLVLIVGVVVLLIVGLSFFRGPSLAPTAFADFQTNLTLRLNISVPEGVCILNINYTNPTSVAYAAGGNAQVPPNTDTDEIGINMTNAGNARHNLSLNASYWAGPNGTHSIMCNQTMWYNISGTAWGAALAQNACYGGGQVGIVGYQAANQSNISYLKVRVPVIVAAGLHNQNVTLTSAQCGT